jgi:hypothetical protein
VESAGFTHGAGRIVRKVRGDFETHISIEAIRRVIHVHEQITGFLNVPDKELLINLLGAMALSSEVLDVGIVVTAFQSKGKRGRIGRDAAQTFLADPAFQISTADHAATEVIQPIALTTCVQLQQA